MYQQPAPQPRDEREWQSSSYANPPGSPAYDEGYRTNPQYNDQLAGANAQRLQYGPRTGIQPTVPSAGQRLALAIVSVIILVPLLGIILGTASFTGFIALLALILVCLTILGINLAFNLKS